MGLRQREGGGREVVGVGVGVGVGGKNGRTNERKNERTDERRDSEEGGGQSKEHRIREGGRE